MKKFLYILPILAMVLGFTACSSDDDVVRHKLTVNVIMPQSLTKALSAESTSDLTLTVFNTATSQITTIPVKDLSASLEVVPGTYNITVFGEQESDSKTYALNGAQTGLEIFANKTINIDLIATEPSPLVFKEVYFSGVPDYYFQDAFYEIYNNTDEVQYLDGIILATVDLGLAYSTSNKDQNSVWMTGATYTNGKYPVTSHVQCFPGNGTQYPIQPRTSVVIAANPLNHSARELAEGDSQSPVDLSGADWQLYVEGGFPADTKIDNVPAMTFLWKTWGREMMPATEGQPLILARLNQNPVDYVAEASSVEPIPGGTINYLMIPVDCVLDAIDIVPADASCHIKRIEIKDDAGMAWYTSENGGNGDYSGKSLRRKVIGFTPNGKAILKDTNNSSNDFIIGGSTPTPGVIPSTIE